MPAGITTTTTTSPAHYTPATTTVIPQHHHYPPTHKTTTYAYIRSDLTAQSLVSCQDGFLTVSISPGHPEPTKTPTPPTRRSKRLVPADPLGYDAVWESNPHTAQRAGWPPDRRRTFVCFFNFPTADPTRAHEAATPGSLDGVPWIYMLPVPHRENPLIEICGSGSSTQSNHPLTTAPNTALRLTETHLSIWPIYYCHIQM